MTVRLAQLTDLHLQRDPFAELKGVRTQDTLHAVLTVLRNSGSPFDRVVLSGDLAHDERRETYAALSDIIDEWRSRLRVIPGNHDDRGFLRQTLVAETDGPPDRVGFLDRLACWTLIGLDSQIPGQVGGSLGDKQLQWLRRVLESEGSRPVALFVHHPPVEVGSRWLDAIGLQDAASFWELVADFPSVRLISCGHIHQEFTASHLGCAVLATPSTGVQFQPETDALCIDSVAPGFRILELHEDGSWRTHVVRVPPDRDGAAS
jgi:Icc protein